MRSLSSIFLFQICAASLFADNTAGSRLDVDPLYFNHPNLTKLTWTASIYEYDYVPQGTVPFRFRMEGDFVSFVGSGSSSPDCFIGAMIQNLGHQFENDVVGIRTPNKTTITEFPALGLYITSLQSTWGDYQHGVELLVNPTIPPRFGRVFEDVDGLGFSAKNVYTRQNVGNPSTDNPITVTWTVEKGDTITDPPGDYSKNLIGDWIPLKGTFVKWRFRIEINGFPYEVADYYLPIEKAEYLWGMGPLILNQEYFGAAEGGDYFTQKGRVRFSNLKASDGNAWYYMQDWKIVYRITDTGGVNDIRFGWMSDGASLWSRVGHDYDSKLFREPGHRFHLAIPTSVTDYSRIPPRKPTVSQNYPNPFNPLTSIDIDLPDTMPLSVLIYNCRGRLIRTLSNEVYTSGRYSLKWDATDDGGNRIDSGVYLGKILAGKFSHVVKLIYLK